MCSDDYKDRFVAEYKQTKVRYERLKNLNTRITAADECPEKVEKPQHDCPVFLLQEQENTMRHYLHILEIRAVIEGIDLE